MFQSLKKAHDLFLESKGDAKRCARVINLLNELSVIDSDNVVWMDMQDSYYSTACLNPWYPIVCVALRCVFGCERMEGSSVGDPSIMPKWATLAKTHRDKLGPIITDSYIALSKSLYLAAINAVDIEHFQKYSGIELPKKCILNKDIVFRSALVMHSQRKRVAVSKGMIRQYDKHMFSRAVELSMAFACSKAPYSDLHSNKISVGCATDLLDKINTTERIDALIRNDPAMYTFVSSFKGPVTTSVYKCASATSRISPELFDVKNIETESALPMLRSAALKFAKAAEKWTSATIAPGALERLGHYVPDGCLIERVIRLIHGSVLKKVEDEAETRTEMSDVIRRARAVYKSKSKKSASRANKRRSEAVRSEIQIADLFLQSMLKVTVPDGAFETEERTNVMDTCSNIQGMILNLRDGKTASTEAFISRQLPPPVPYYHLSPEINIDLTESRRTLLRAILYASALGTVVRDLRALDRHPKLLRDALKKLQGYLRYLSHVRYIPSLIITTKESWIMNPPPEWSESEQTQDETTGATPATEGADSDSEADAKDRDAIVVPPPQAPPSVDMNAQNQAADIEELEGLLEGYYRQLASNMDTTAAAKPTEEKKDKELKRDLPETDAVPQKEQKEQQEEENKSEPKQIEQQYVADDTEGVQNMSSPIGEICEQIQNKINTSVRKTLSVCLISNMILLLVAPGLSETIQKLNARQQLAKKIQELEELGNPELANLVRSRIAKH